MLVLEIERTMEIALNIVERALECCVLRTVVFLVVLNFRYENAHLFRCKCCGCSTCVRSSSTYIITSFVRYYAAKVSVRYKQ